MPGSVREKESFGWKNLRGKINLLGNEGKVGFCREKMEVGELKRMWKDEEDEEK